MRRTSTIDVSWPNGLGGDLRLIGRARDLLTPDDNSAPVVKAENAVEVQLRPDRTIVAIDAQPPYPELSQLIGQRGGGGLRKALARTVPEELKHGTPLYLLLDDLAGASLVAGWAWSQWDPDWLTTASTALKDFDLEKAFRDRMGICAGFAPGSSGLDLKTDRSGTPTSDLRNPADPIGWHAFPPDAGVSLRRARRIDIWTADQLIFIDSAFQDSATTPAGGRAVVHEYSLTAQADPMTGRLLAVEAHPHVLPFSECPNAAANVSLLIGTPLHELRERVLEQLRGSVGCTHLNDALRALADVPALLASLHEPLS